MTDLRPNTTDTAFVDEVAAKLAGRRATRGTVPLSGDTLQASRLNEYMEAASVLSWYDPESIRPVEREPDQRARDELLASSSRVTDAGGTPRWSPLRDKRIQALRQLRESGRIRAALDANHPPPDRLQQLLSAYLTGTAPSVENQTFEDLSISFQIRGWLSAAGFDGLPSAESITLRSDRLSLLQPFQHLAGENFRGRKTELEKLRQYAGVLPPSTTLGSIGRAVEKFFNFKAKAPLLVFGPGGVGKSTLIARFILEHAEAEGQDRFPFVYLDFDRPDITAAQPLSLLGEAVRQLGIEYPLARETCEDIRRRWRAQFASLEYASERMPSVIRDFASLIATLGSEDRPVVFVLDTLEEVQYASADLMRNVWQFLERLQGQVPRLRAILVGRAKISDADTDNLELAGLDDEAAVSYLQQRGVGRSVARRLVRQVGGSPLSLKLAAAIAVSDGLDEKGDLPIERPWYSLFKLDNDLIQRQLYRRILGHIHNEDVRKLAHPGLVLRRITPDLIEHVLKQPCGISREVNSTVLFEELKREVALVQDDGKNAVRHRDELRPLMLKLIYRDEPARTGLINRNAVEWYSNRPFDPMERAEEIYHRLVLNQDFKEIDARWEPGVESFLKKNAMWEFAGRRKAYLANRLGLGVDGETAKLADLEDWERLVAPQASRMLARGQAEDALALVTARGDRTVASPIVTLQAQALARLGRGGDALAVLENGFTLAGSGGEIRQAFSLALQYAEIVIGSTLASQAVHADEQLAGFEGTFGSQADRLDILTRRSGLAALSPDLATNLAVLRKTMISLFFNLTDEELAGQPKSAWWAGAMLGPMPDDLQTAAKVLARIFSKASVPFQAQSLVRSLAAEIASFDASRPGGTPRELTRALGVPMSDTLTVTWATFLLSATDKAASDAVSKVLMESPISAGVVQCCIMLLRSVVGIDDIPHPSHAPEKASSTGLLELTPRQREMLRGAIVQAFSQRELGELLQHRLQRTLEVYSVVRRYDEMVFELIDTAQRQGWLGDLLASLLDARPNNPNLIRAAGALGITTLASQALSIEGVVRNNYGATDIETFTATLGEVQSWVCMVRVGEIAQATGMLVNKNLVLTAFVVSQSVMQKARPQDVRIHFDYRRAGGGQVVSAGIEFMLDDDWIAAQSPLDPKEAGLGYVLLRLNGSPGTMPIGTLEAESVALARGWFNLSQSIEDPSPAETVFIPHYARGGPLVLATGKLAPYDWNGVSFRYDANAGPGSSGAPILSQRFRLIGMHLGRDKELSYGARMRAIVNDLGGKGLLGTIQTPLA